jgi:hypothetical protein
MKRLRRHSLLLVTALLVAACGVPAVTIATRPSPQSGAAGTARIEPARL